MSSAINETFHKKSFLKSGGIYGRGGRVYLFLGERKSSSHRPPGPSLCRRSFFDESPLLWESFEQTLELDYKQAGTLFDFHPQSRRWKSPEFGDFEKQFLWIREAFAKKGLKKGVPYAFETSPQTAGSQELESMIASGLKHDQGFLFGEWNHQGGILGLTPEILLSQKSEKQFETMALGGTCTLQEFEINPHGFFEDKKQREEHGWIVSDIKKQLAPLANLSIGELAFAQTPTLVHLWTPIEFEIKNKVDINDLILALHPTAALACSPHHLWKSIMTPLNQWCPRGDFGAPFGVSLGSNRMDFVVAIRCLIWDNTGFKLGSGCGVVTNSDLKEEWQELENKRESVKRIFGL